ncbi:MAG: endonuclease/exonuclease/phosphatase family protein [Planctomycetaceae bacterium]
MSWTNCLAIAALWLLIFAVSERWWVGTALTFFPRWPWVLPSLALMVFSPFFNRRYVLLNLLSALFVCGPVSQYQFAFGSPPRVSADALGLKVVTCNVQGYRQDFSSVVNEMVRLDPDVIALQEALPENESIARHFGTWHTVHVGEFWIGSRYPVRIIDECYSKAFDRRTAICAAIETPRGEIRLINLHQMTARRALNELKGEGLINGRGSRRVERQALLRDDEARQTREFVDYYCAGKPTLIVGDFNLPTSSSIYRSHWGHYLNAFEEVGEGFGYTSPCSRFWWWPLETPWLRIDHIIGSSHWQPTHCHIGSSTGSDHRLVFARWQLNRSAD